MKQIIVTLCLSFIINSTQIFASTRTDLYRVQTELRTRFDNSEYPSLGSPQINNLAQFYRSRQYRPVWIDENGITVAAKHALATLENASGEGLDPNDYKQAFNAVNDAENYPERAMNAEIALTKAVLQYIDDVNGNRFNPQRISNELFVKKSVVSAPKVLADKMNADPSGAWLESYTFNNPHYQTLKDLLAEYRQMLQESLYRDNDISRKIHQIVINMERWRWLPEKMPERYAIINIAAYELKCIENDNVILEMPVVIGKDYRKTPVLVSTVESIRFNPSWHLPRHIAVEDSLPKIQANPDYINYRKYVLTNSAGKEISPYSVNWSNINASNFNFHLRQIPGDHNALGKIRFGLTNSKGIYLHDTADKEDFDDPVKTKSSGCVRLKYPDKFASFVFDDPDEWPLSKIRENMEGIETKNVPLTRSLPVYITYFTVWESETGMKFADDVYDKDQQLINALKNPFYGVPMRIDTPFVETSIVEDDIYTYSEE